MNTITLPWPPRHLNPNAREHWRSKAIYTKSYKTVAWTLAKEAKLRAPPVEGGIFLRIGFHPPNKLRRDLDNMLASVKAGIDGIALAMGVDDSRFGYKLSREDVVKHGKVVVTVEAEEVYVNVKKSAEPSAIVSSTNDFLIS